MCSQQPSQPGINSHLTLSLLLSALLCLFSHSHLLSPGGEEISRNLWKEEILLSFSDGRLSRLGGGRKGGGRRLTPLSLSLTLSHCHL